MGLFGKDPDVDGEVRSVLLTQDRGSLKAAEKAQPTLRRLVQPGEKIEFLAMGANESAIAVVGARVYLLAPGLRVLHEVPLTQIRFVSQTPSRMNTTFLEGALNLNVVPKPQWPWSTFASEATAREVCVRINRMILAARPRSIPKLNRAYFEEILVKAGKSVTPGWLNEVAYRQAWVLGGAVAACLGTNPNPELFDEFMRRFSPVIEGEDFLNLPDDIIDWAWAKHPVMHDPLIKKVDKHRGNTEGAWLEDDEPQSSEQRRAYWAQPGPLWLFTFNDQKLYAYAPV